MSEQSKRGWKYSTAIIAVFWTYLIVDAYLQGLEVPELLEALPLRLPELPAIVWVALLTLIFSTCFFVTFWQRKHLMEDMPYITPAVDRRFGEGAYRNFSRRLRPVAISMVSSFLLALTGLRATFDSTKSTEGYLLSFVFLSIATGLLFALLLSKRFPPELR